MSQFPSGDGAPPGADTSNDSTSAASTSRDTAQGSGPGLSADTVWKAAREKEAECPLFLSSVQAGFPSPADDYVETTLDLNEALHENETSTFFVRVSGRSMKDIGIRDGDIIVVDRSIKPEEGSVVVAALDGELTVKRYSVRNGQPVLLPENPDCAPIPIEEGQSFVVWGVVTQSIREIS